MYRRVDYNPPCPPHRHCTFCWFGGQSRGYDLLSSIARQRGGQPVALRDDIKGGERFDPSTSGLETESATDRDVEVNVFCIFILVQLQHKNLQKITWPYIGV